MSVDIEADRSRSRESMSLEMTKDILKLFYAFGRTTILDFPRKILRRNVNGIPVSGGTECRYCTLFDQYLALFVSSPRPSAVRAS